MFKLVHGSDPYKIDDYLNNYSSYSNFYGDVNDLENRVSSNDLFGKKNDLIINLQSNTKLKIGNSVYRILNRYKKGQNSDFIFVNYSKINLSKKDKDFFDEIKEFKVEDNKEIFAFLDSLFLGRKKKSFKLVNKFLEKDQEMYLISMIYYVLNNITLYYYDREAFNKLNPYVQKKTKGFAKNINKKDLKDLVYVLSEADYKIKMKSVNKSIIISLVNFILVKTARAK